MSTFRLSHVAAGMTAVVVGYSSAVVLVIEAARAAGANEAMVVSWLLLLGLGMGVTCIGYSWYYRQPVVTAWSTPGAAFLLVSVGEFPLAEVIGAFVVAAFCSLVAARSQTLTRRIGQIPPAISSAMLAGILMPICLGVFRDVGQFPLLVAAFIALYLLGSRWFPRYLMLVLLILALICSGYMTEGSLADVTLVLPAPVWVTPEFSLTATISLAIPLFLITLLSQNLPGMAILQSHGYQPNHRLVLTGLALLQGITAPFGGFTFNYAAITAALCMGDNVDPDPANRYPAAIVAGIGYLVMGALASVVVVLFSQMPQVIIHLLAGLALLGTLQAALTRALESPHTRHAALLTFLCSASGMSAAHLSAPVWGLLLGLLLLWLQGTETKKPA